MGGIDKVVRTILWAELHYRGFERERDKGFASSSCHHARIDEAVMQMLRAYGDVGPCHLYFRGLSTWV